MKASHCCMHESRGSLEVPGKPEQLGGIRGKAKNAGSILMFNNQPMVSIHVTRVLWMCVFACT